jgi:hypothetical protein
MPDANTTEVNEILAQVCTPKSTTYSFRRNFIHRVLTACTDEGVVDYSEAMKYTVHENENTLRAHDQRHVSDAPLADPNWLVAL